MKRFSLRFIALVFMLVIIVVAVTIPLPSLAGFIDTAPERDVAAIEEAIERAFVQCYALEGSYPPNIEYLAAHYGIQLDREHYFYHYEVYGANLRPNVTVFKK